MLLETVFNDKKHFYQPIESIQEIDWKAEWLHYWNYQEVLAIKFVWSTELTYIIDNPDNRESLSKNMYNLK